jgi:hypothetical protein
MTPVLPSQRNQHNDMLETPIQMLQQVVGMHKSLKRLGVFRYTIIPNHPMLLIYVTILGDCLHIAVHVLGSFLKEADFRIKSQKV